TCADDDCNAASSAAMAAGLAAGGVDTVGAGGPIGVDVGNGIGAAPGAIGGSANPRPPAFCSANAAATFAAVVRHPHIPHTFAHIRTLSAPSSPQRCFLSEETID